jgi:hypothetical protein
MEDFKVLKLFLLSIVNLLIYLLSIYFITSIYFTKSITFYFKNAKDLPLSSHYKQVSISFAFHTIFFLCYIVSLFITIYKSDISSESSNEKSEINHQTHKEKSKFEIFIDYALLVLFGICHFFYLLNLILISIDLGHIKEINIVCILDRDIFIKGIYRDLLIVGYIFFFILLLISIWALLITEQKFNCIPYIKKKFKSFEEYLENNIEDTSEKLENKIQKLNEGLRNLKHTNSENFDSFSEQVQIQGTLN